MAMAAADFEDGLVLYYPFEGHGNEIDDVSGENNHGKLHTAEREADGRWGRAIRFDEPSLGAEIPPSPSLLVEDGDDGFTVSFWVYPEEFDFNGENRAIYRHQQYNVDLLVGRGRMEVRIGGAWKGTGLAPQLNTDEWHLVTAAWSPDDGSMLYRDGILATANAGAIGDIEEHAETTFLAFMLGLPGYVGRMDDLRIYNRPLDEDEVFELFDFEPGAQAISPEGSLATTWGAVRATK